MDTSSAGVRLVLASASPARRATLEAAGITPVVAVSAVDEDAVVAAYGVSAPEDVALLLARAKAEDVAAALDRASRAGGDPADGDPADGDPADGDPADGDPAGGGTGAPGDLPEELEGALDGALVLGCDSVLDLDGVVHGKPSDPQEAVERWRAMRGRHGVLHTGHWLVDAREEGTGGTLGAVASTTVRFADLTDAEIEAYVATGEPLRVAGAFTIDGLGGAFVTGIEGDHHNVVGLSLPLLRELLLEVKVPWPALWTRC